MLSYVWFLIIAGYFFNFTDNTFGFIFLLNSLLGDSDPPMTVGNPLVSEMPCEFCDYDPLMLSYGWILILARYFFNFTDNTFGLIFLLRSPLRDNDPPMSVVTPLVSEMPWE